MIPDEAREALHAAVDAGWRTNWGDSFIDVDEFLVGLASAGYTVVKLPTEGVLAEAIGSDLDATTFQEDREAARRVLALLRGEGQ